MHMLCRRTRLQPKAGSQRISRNCSTTDTDKLKDSGHGVCVWLQPESQGDWLFTVGGGRLRLIKSTIGSKVPSSAYTRRPDEISTDENSSKSWPEQIPARGGGGGGDGGGRRRRLWERRGGRNLRVGG
ncbi:meiotically up-regulated protein [Dorcoceras hygrometricum]|uniref:Meiotically up-regulated protein n=1 Tax=Dorcoceras hygrometricum TaxID=472368 RepID=A0A2Z7A5E2_9LAMI|nr:meiotically up-regulated protein [Dorcoceras hygrometricum]